MMFYKSILKTNPILSCFWRCGKLQYTYSYNGIFIWSIGNGTVIKKIPIPIVVTFASFSPDNKYLVGLEKDNIYVFEVATGTLKKTISGVPPMYPVSISHDSNYIIGTSVNGGSVYIWDLLTGSLIMNQYNNLDKAIYNSDGNAIAASWNDSIVRIYPFPSLQEIINQTRERFKNRQLTTEERRMYYLEKLNNDE